MNEIMVTGLFMIGLAVGAIVAGVVLSKIRSRETNHLSEQANLQKSALEEKLAQAASSAEKLDKQLQVAHEKVETLSMDLVTLKEQKSMLEERVLSIPELKAEIERKSAVIESLRNENGQYGVQLARMKTLLDDEKSAAQEKIALLKEARIELENSFKALASDALDTSGQNFLKLARSTLEKERESAKGELDKRKTAFEELVKPIRETLKTVDTHMGDLEKQRLAADATLREQIQSLRTGQMELTSQTGNLVSALRQPSQRGMWGEVQLQRVVELAGMVDHCDFRKQVSVNGEGGKLRPDMVVHLPNGAEVIVDAKTPMSAFLQAMEARDDATRQQYLAQHAVQVKTHIGQLSAKSYQDQFENTPEFVVMFIPGESLFGAALEQDPSLIEEGVKANVILATPTTLIALLRAVAFGWRQESLAKNARDISELGKELYKRFVTFSKHLEKMGGSLKSSVDHYNKAVGSMERNLMPQARKFETLKVIEESATLPSPEPVTADVRAIGIPELPAPPEKKTDSTPD